MTTDALPKTVTIGGQSVKLKVAEMDDWGSYEHDARTITLSSDCLRKRSDLISTLRHEMVHAALHISGVSFLERYDEEAIVRCFDQIFQPAWDRVTRQLNRTR